MAETGGTRWDRAVDRADSSGHGEECAPRGQRGQARPQPDRLDQPSGREDAQRAGPNWLSRRLSVRQDLIVFPVLEEGRITFVQASELLSAPVATRRTLLDRELRAKRRVSLDELRTWVHASREQVRRGQQRVVDQLAAERSSGPERRPSPTARCAQVLEMVRDLALPSPPEEIATLADLVACLQERWELVRPRRSWGRPRLSVVPCVAAAAGRFQGRLAKA